MGEATAQPCKANIQTCDTAFEISTLTHITEEGFKEEKKWNADQAWRSGTRKCRHCFEVIGHCQANRLAVLAMSVNRASS